MDITATNNTRVRFVLKNILEILLILLILLTLLSSALLAIQLINYIGVSDREVELQSSMDKELELFSVSYENASGEVTVAGLLTGVDICRALKDESLGDELLLPITTLRAEHDLFLCGMTPEEMADVLGVPIRFTDNDGGAFLDAVLGSGGLTFGDCDA